MPYNIKPITDPQLIESRKRSVEEDECGIHRKRKERLKGYVKDFDYQEFEDRIHSIISCLEIYREGLTKTLEEHEDADAEVVMSECYYFTMENILEQIDEFYRTIEGFNEYVSLKQAEVKGYEDWLPEKKENGQEVKS